MGHPIVKFKENGKKKYYPCLEMTGAGPYGPLQDYPCIIKLSRKLWLNIGSLPPK